MKIDKSDKLIIDAFIKRKVPYDFENVMENSVFVDTIMGLALRMIKNKEITKEEISSYQLNDEGKKRISKYLSNSENLSYYLLIKLVYVIASKYAV